MIQRTSANDLMQLASDLGDVPLHVAGILMLRPPPGWELGRALVGFASRLAALPRMGDLLRAAPFGCGRAYWLPDPGLDPRRHVEVVPCPAPGDDAALLATALEVIARPLPRTRPLWRLSAVTGLPDGRVALVVVVHHVVADGLGGLALLQDALADRTGDGAPVPAGPRERQPPSPAALAVDAWRTRARSLRHLPDGVRRLRAGIRELRLGGRPRAAPPTSLNRPVGPRREGSVVHVPLDAVRGAAHRVGATVNDVVLTGVVGALMRVLAARGEAVPRLVLSVPVAGAREDAQVGNVVGVMPVEVPTLADPVARLQAVATATRAQRGAARGSSAALLEPAFRLLAALGLLRPLIRRQRLVNTFVSSMRGPDHPLSLSGAPVEAVVPASGLSGNVGVAFTVLSYAGDLAVLVLVDPEISPPAAEIADALAGELAALSSRTPLVG